MRPLPNGLSAFLFAVVICRSTTGVVAAGRDVAQLKAWGLQHGVDMHEALVWNQSSEDNLGLELQTSVDPGTVLLKVPRALVLDARRIQREMQEEFGHETCQQALQIVQQQVPGLDHSDGLWIFLQLVRLKVNNGNGNGNASSNNNNNNMDWTPYLNALPSTFPPPFTPEEQECLVPYARAAVHFQQQKFQAYCRAAQALFQNDPKQLQPPLLQWAFECASSRCWKAIPKHDSTNGNVPQPSTTELVPIGDLFNHCEPPNVVIDHDEQDGSVLFIYKGNHVNNHDDNKNHDKHIPLYLSYGQPSNPHRFLVQFGFVPTISSMPHVWSHLAYAHNPFTADTTEACVVRSSDGILSKACWDAVLYALKEDPGTPTPHYTHQQHVRYLKFTLNVLSTHLHTVVQELQTAHSKLLDDATTANTNPVIRQHVTLLSTVFQRAHTALQQQARYYDPETDEVVALN